MIRLPGLLMIFSSEFTWLLLGFQALGGQAPPRRGELFGSAELVRGSVFE